MMELSKLKIKSKEDVSLLAEYYMIVKDLIQDKSVQSMNDYIQHADVSCLEHCLNVSYKSFLLCRHLNLDYRSAARGGLLHDFFLYDWHITKPENGLHGFTHARASLENANERFDLNELEKDIIAKHMWPLNLSLPKYRESFIVVLVDKYCSLVEIVRGKLARCTIHRLNGY